MNNNLLVDTQGLIKALFNPKCAPSEKWIERNRKAGKIPFSKIGRLIYYDPEQVRAALFAPKPATGEVAK